MSSACRRLTCSRLSSSCWAASSTGVVLSLPAAACMACSGTSCQSYIGVVPQLHGPHCLQAPVRCAAGGHATLELPVPTRLRRASSSAPRPCQLQWLQTRSWGPRTGSWSLPLLSVHQTWCRKQVERRPDCPDIEECEHHISWPRQQVHLECGHLGCGHLTLSSLSTERGRSISSGGLAPELTLAAASLSQAVCRALATSTLSRSICRLGVASSICSAASNSPAVQVTSAQSQKRLDS